MAIEAQLPDGRILEFPDGTDPEVIQSTAKRLMVSPLSHLSDEELKGAKSAPFSAKDILRSGGTGVVGGLGSLAAVGGASSAPAQYLEEKTQAIQSGLSPERIAEMQRREEIIRRAEASGSTWEKVKAGLGAVGEAPLQSLAQGLGSVVTPVAAISAAVALAPEGLAAGVGIAMSALVGSLMGAGESKREINDRVKREFEKAGDRPDVAAKKADEAQSWLGENLDQIMLGAGAGALEGATGAGRFASGAVRTARGLKPVPSKPLTMPTKLGTAAGAALEEAAPEFIQSLAGTAAGNIAASRAGFETDTFAGATSAATRDALIGALTGAAVSPVQYKSLQMDFLRQQQEEANKRQQEFEKQREEFAKKHMEMQQKIKEQLGLNILALPAPSPKAEDKFRNPAATITKEEMGPEASKYVDDYRKANNLPVLKTYSIEDIQDAMPGINPEGEKGIIDSILAGKYGYKPVDETTGEEIVYAPNDVLTLASEEKNIATGTQGFRDFLTSVTGTGNVEDMTQPQLHAAYSALRNFEPSEETRILPQGTAATRFSQKQYDQAVKWVGITFKEYDNKPLDPTEIVKDIKEATGLESDRDAYAILDTAIKNGDLTFTTKPVFRVVDPATGQFVHTAATRKKAEAFAKGKDLNIFGDSQAYISPAEPEAQPQRETLPAGYQITQDKVVEGEEDLVDVMREGKGQPLETIAADKAQERIEKLTGESRELADAALKRIERDSATVERIQKNLDTEVAKGYGKTRDFEIQKTRSEGTITHLRRRIQKNLEKIEELSAPIKTRKSEVKKPIIKKKLTVTKNGKVLGTFSHAEIGKASAQAQDAILTQMSDEEIQAAIDDKKLGLFREKAKEEQERRRGPTGFRIARRKVEKEEETPPLAPEFVEAADEIAKVLNPILQRMGLGDVGLKIVQAIKNGGDGSYKDKLIKLAIDAKNHLEVMHHEALHALKDLGFFTDAQWSALEKMAKKEWINKYLKNVQVELNGKTMSRYDAYVYISQTEPQEWNKANPDKAPRKVMSDQELNDLLVEEAIADAFADFATNPPAGMIAAIIKRLNAFFNALRNAIMRSGFESAEDIFGKAQRGELKGAANEPTKTVKRPGARGDEGGERLSLAGGRERGGRREVGSNTPLAGSPVIQGASGPDPRIVKVAEDYAKKAGIPFRRQSRYADVYVNKAKRIGQAYEEMKHDPQDPEVKEAYADMIRQTRAQYDALVNAGYTFTFFDSNTDPYGGNPFNAMRDLRKNKRMAVYGTYDGYGTEGITGAAIEDNPMLADTGLRWKDQNEVEHPVTANDLFRAVHDAFGHGLEGAGFRAKGEENAWQAHGKMYTGPALGAMTSETRGQNSWLNFGPYGEKNRTAKLEDTVFAEQKTGLMPEWTWSEGLTDDEEGVSLGKRQEGASTFDGIHYGNVRTNSLAGSKYGTGIRGSEAKRLDRSDDPRIKNRVYFYIEKPNGEMPTPEAGVGNKVYTQRLNNILAPGSQMAAISREALGDSNTFESLVVDAGYDGYAIPDMGMMVVLNHDVPVNYQGERAELLEKLSLRIMRGEEIPDLKGKQTIHTVGKYFDDQVMATFGRKLSFTNPQDMDIAFKQAVDEVAYQLKQPKSGLDWYDQNIKDAFKTTIQIIPELKKADKRILFSVISGILSPNTNARDNWFIGAKAFQHYLETGIISGVNPENGRLWQGGTQSANKKVQMEFLNNMVASMGEKKALTWLMQDHPVSEINEFRSKYGNLKSGIAGKATDIKPALYAFGPKVGPFVSNLNGIHDVTVDKWMTRTFNRYFGTMIGPDGDIIDSPTEPQRRAIKELINRVAQDANIKPYQVQSLLWFYEQKLFTKLGVPSPSYEFSDGARKFYDESRGAGGQPSGAGVTGADEKLSLRSTRQPPESKEFKQWFTGSYFTSNGEPLVMYHGTARDINIFKGKQAKAIFFTTKPEVAETYSDMGEDYMRGEAYQALTREEKVQLITVVAEQAERDGKISAKELKEITNDLKKRVPPVNNENKRITGMPYQIEQEIIESLNNLLPTRGNIMPIYVNAKNIFDYANKDDVNRVYQWMMHNSSATGRMQNPDQWLSSVKGLISRGNWNRIESEPVQEAILALGFDGFSVLEAGTKNYAVYNPTQIKSVTGNIGTWGIGEVTTEQAKRFGMTADQARKAQEEGDIRLSLKTRVPSAINASIEKTTTVREEKGFVERMMDAISPKGFSSWRAEALNRYNALGVADKMKIEKRGGKNLYADQSAEAMALLSDDAAGVAAAAMGVHDRHGGVPVYRNGITTIDNSVEGIIPIFAPLARYKDPYIYQMWQFYAGAKRARRYLDKGIEKNYDANDIAFAQQLGKDYPEFEEIFKKWDKYNKGLVKYMVDTGVLSPERGAEYIKYADYVPFYRQLEDQKTFGPNVFQSISAVKPPKKYKGGEAPIADLMENIVRNTQSAILAGMKNTAAQMAVDTFVEIGQAEAAPDGSTGEEYVHVLKNGEKKSYLVYDKALVQAVMSLNIPELPFIGFFAGPANLLRNLVTKDPGFMLANMVRDSMSAWVTSGVKMTPVASAVKNFTGALRGTSPEYQALLNAGILGGYDYSQNVEVSAANLKKALGKYAPSTGLEKIKNAPSSLWEALEKGTMASDAATRIEVYKNVMAETGNEAEALFRAQEVMNFNRKGRSAVVRVLTAAVPFLNARMQGLDVLYRSMFGKMGTVDAKKIQKAFFVRGSSIMAMSMIYWALTHDDDEYKKQEQETRDNYWLIPSLGIKLPIPFEVGVIFKVIPERIAEYYLGTDTAKDFADSMKRNFMNTFAFNLIPQTVLPLYEAKTGYSFFTQRRIVGQGLESVAPEYQIGPNTSQLAAWLGKELGYSPMLIDHIIGGYTGAFGTYTVDVMDAMLFSSSDVQKPSKRFEQLPLFKRFLLDPQAKGKVTAYYDLKNSVDEAVRTSNFLEKTANLEELGKYNEETLRVLASKDFVSGMEKEMKKLREASVYIRSSNMSADDKRDLLISITDAENALADNVRYLRKLMD